MGLFCSVYPHCKRKQAFLKEGENVDSKESEAKVKFEMTSSAERERKDP